MKKLFLLLLLIPSLLCAQRVDYYPRVDNNWNKIREFAVAAIVPDNYTASKQWGWAIAVHGIGERGAGSKAQLENLILGADYDGNGTRDGLPFITADIKRAVNELGIVVFVPVYENFFEPAQVNLIYDFARSQYSLTPKFLLSGFSLGGGAVLKYITSNLTNAGRVAYAIPCAPTGAIVDASIPGKANLPVHIFVNRYDPNRPTDTSVTKAAVNAINASNPSIKAIYTAFNITGHGGFGEAHTLYPPKAPGGIGFIDASENIYQVFTDILANGPRQMKSGSVITPLPTPTVKAIVSFTLTGNQLKLIGSKSTGYTNGLEGVWEYTGGPVQYSWDVFPKGSSYIDADAVLTKPGIYNFSFKLKGDPEVKTVTVDFGKFPVAFDSDTDLLTYSDGSTEKATAVFSSGKWVVKTAAGQIVQL